MPGLAWSGLPIRFTPRSDSRTLRDMAKKRKTPRTPHQTVQAFVGVLKFMTRLEKGLHKFGPLRGVTRKKPLLSKTDNAAGLRLAKFHLNKPQDFWPKIEMFGHSAAKHIVTFGEHQTQRISASYQLSRRWRE